MCYGIYIYLVLALLGAMPASAQTTDDGGPGNEEVASQWFYLGVVDADAQADGWETGFRTAFHGEDYFFTAVELGFLRVWETRAGNLPRGYRFGSVGRSYRVSFRSAHSILRYGDAT